MQSTLIAVMKIWVGLFLLCLKFNLYLRYTFDLSFIQVSLF